MKRIFGLDLLRAAAMICVIVAHCGYSTIFGLRYGLIAVESFFVISGYLIGEMLIRDFEKGFEIKDLKNFWIKRWFRTLPLYYFTIILKFIFIDHSIGANIGWYFLFLQNNVYGIGFLAVSWTLVLEEWFYLLMPVIFYIFFKKGINGKNYFLFFIGFLLLENVLRIGWVGYTNRPFGAMVGNFPFRLDSFLIGVALAALKVFYKDTFDKLAKIGPTLISGVLFLVLLYFFKRDDLGNANNSIFWIRTVWFSFVSIAIALMLPYFTNASIFNNPNDPTKFKWAVSWLSLLSYPIYLIHLDTYRCLEEAFPALLNAHPALLFAINNTVVVILSIALYKFIHNPVIKLRNRLVK